MRCLRHIPTQPSCILLSDGYTWSVSVSTQAEQKSTPEKTTFVPAVGLLLRSRRRMWTQAQRSPLSLPPCTRTLRLTYSRPKSTQTLSLALPKCTMTRNPNYSLFRCARTQSLLRPPSRRRSWTRQPQSLVGVSSGGSYSILAALCVLSHGDSRYSKICVAPREFSQWFSTWKLLIVLAKQSCISDVADAFLRFGLVLVLRIFFIQHSSTSDRLKSFTVEL